MPLPQPSEQEGKSVKAGQEPSVGARKPQESSSLVLARGKGGPKPRGGKSRKKSGSGRSRKKSGSGRSLKKSSSGKSLEKSGSGTSLENSGSGRSLENSGSGTSLENSGSGRSLENSGSGRSLEKSGSGTSLEKPGSGTSLEKPGSGTSLEKPGSGTSLEKPGSGTSLENSGSGTSLEKPGPATLPSNTVQTSTVKKQGRIIHRKRSRVDAADPQPLQFLKTPYGGRLLVHKSFLYKQEKAVGDKVYWKCRLHSDRGCRGRAITRGFRVTVMRDHCHPPDKGSLGGRRRKEKVPASDLPEGTKGQEDGVSLWLYPEEPEPTPQQSTETPEEDQGYRSLALQCLPPKKRPTPGVVRYQPLEFLKTCYGGTFLVHQSFLYKREKTVGSKVYWTCREHAVHGCRSRAITQGQRVTIMRSHCHSPDMEGLRARRQQEKTIKKIQARRIGAGDLEDCDDIEDSLLQGVDSLFYRRGQGTLTLSRSRSRKQAMEQQESLQESPEEEDQDVDPRGPEFLRTPLGGSFLVYESFLYRREKAAGEKVYWTCRDQARMGCRSRAITQGRQVTVMRGHCHPPDLLGLETLRQREKRPGHAQWDGPEGPEFLKTPLGGSFLVYESFLYRREKATGDKVYWTCRDQARMGCRSRAITQGQRVMVMRRHCHPPDMGGLEALRQRENFPNLTHWEGPEPVQPLEFLRTSLGGRFLVYESFLYRKEKAAGEKVYWMCRDQARLGCRSRAITQGRRVMVMRSHCHPPDLAGLEALRQREKGLSAAKKKKKKKKKGKSKS